MKVEIRDNSVILDGYVNVVSRDSRVLPSIRGKFVEQMVPSVFKRALEKADNVDLLYNHKNDRKLGSISEGNLELYEDSIGLRAIAKVDDPEVVELAKNKSLRGWSFGFIANEDKWEDGGDVQRRYVSDIDLLEVSILSVTPAYIATSIEARGDEEVIKELRYEDNFKDDDADDVDDKDEDELETTEEGKEVEENGDDDEDDESKDRSLEALYAELQNYITIKR
jgi:hypothetical protein